MPGARHKKIQPPIRKVTYVEVKRKRGNFFREVTVASSPIMINQTPSVQAHDHWLGGEPLYDADIPIVVNSLTKV
jgi:hypothetical protein